MQGNEQDEWVASVFGIAPSSQPAAGSTAKAAAAKTDQQQIDPSLSVSIFNISQTHAIRFKNLQLDVPDTTVITPAPLTIIGPNGRSDFKLTNVTHGAFACQGNITYVVDGDATTSLRMAWAVFRGPSSGVEPPDEDRYRLVDDSNESNREFYYTFDTMDHAPPPDPGPFFPPTIQIENNSADVLHRVGARLSDPAASFTTEPDKAINGPGRTVFSVETSNADGSGTSGFVSYRVLRNDTETQITFHWNNHNKPSHEIRPDGNVFSVKQGSKKERVVFILNATPAPQPQPDRHVTVAIGTSSEKSTLRLLGRSLDNPSAAKFSPEPPDVITKESPGLFEVHTNSTEERAMDGIVRYEIVDDPQATVLIMRWNAPESQDFKIVPASEAYKPVFSARAGHFVFGLQELPKPEPLPEFDPPPPPGDPTMRNGDGSPDGWVEYLQELLFDNGYGLKIDGVFGDQTTAAVIDFQTKKGLSFHDGIVGNETWSALREGERKAAGTDGRKPHTYIDEGQDARFTREKEAAIYLRASDEMWLLVTAVGTKPIDEGTALVRVTPPGGTAATTRIIIGPPNQRTATGEGNVHTLKLAKFRETYKAADANAPIGDYIVEAYFEKPLAGDTWKGSLVEV